MIDKINVAILTKFSFHISPLLHVYFREYSLVCMSYTQELLILAYKVHNIV